MTRAIRAIRGCLKKPISFHAYQCWIELREIMIGSMNFDT
jgi:hypothetical protein